jgi:hypothetical protein
MRSIDIWRVRADLAVKHWDELNRLEAFAQLGLATCSALTTPNDDRVVRMGATAHGPLALRTVGKLPTDRAHLHRKLDTVIADLQPHSEEPS